MSKTVRLSRSTARLMASTVLAAALAAFFVDGHHLKAAGGFTPGNLVVVRMGDGTAALSSAAASVFLDEFATSGGAAVQSVALPTTVTTPGGVTNYRFTDSGSATSDGSLNRSTDGRFLTLAAYDADPGTTGVVASAAARVVARVAADGTIDTSTRMDGYGGNNIRGAITDDGSRFWTAGTTSTTGGTRFVTFGSSSGIQISASVTNTRTVNIFGGQLYMSAASGAFQGVSTVGTGLPTTSGQTTTALPGFPTASGPSSYGFVLLDLNAGVTGLDTAYVADDRSAASGGGIQKWTFNGTTWSLAYTLGLGTTSAGGARGVVADASGANVVLYATTTETSANRLVKITDTGAGSAFTVLATAGTNEIFRGVAFTPQSAPAITTQPASQSIVTGQSANLAVTVSGSATITYQWYLGASSDTSSPIGGATSATFAPAPTSTTSYWVRATNSLGHADSATAIVTVTAVATPTITTQPLSQSILSGATATLTVAATGPTPITYQWYVGTSGDTSNAIGGATGTIFTTPILTATTSYWVQVTNAGGSTNSQTAIVTVIQPACSAPHVPINTVQGSGATSPKVGQTVTVKGVVVGDFDGPGPASGLLEGFYLQDLPADDDGDPTTSEGIFVFEGDMVDRVSLGQVVQVTGVVAEFGSNGTKTEINSPTIESCGTTADVTPTDVTLPLPAPVSGVSYLERFEGMLVRFHQTLFVTDNFDLGEFGQVTMSSTGRLVQPTSVLPPGPQAAAMEAANQLNQIIVDDQYNSSDPDPVLFGDGGNPLSASNTLRGGDSAANIIGVITQESFSTSPPTGEYHLRPVNALHGGVPVFQPANARPTATPTVGGRLRIVGMNVENYFLTLDVTGNSCGPAGHLQECRGANTVTELQRQQAKLNAALVKLNGDVVGMSELENTDNVDSLGDIVGRLNATTGVGAGTYSYISYPGTGTAGTDAIKVGIMYKPALVTPIGAPMIHDVVVQNRAPVAQTFKENSSGEVFTVVVNHLRSKSCSTNPANPLDNDQGDGQSCFNYTRTQQALDLLSFVQTTVIPAAGDPDVLLIGDFNSYAHEDPITTIEQAGFTNLTARFSGPFAYSYLFDGEWGYIDQALASTSLVPQMTGANDYHVNADEPIEFDYNTEFKDAAQIVSMYNPDEFRYSDHDPLLIGMALRTAPQARSDSYATTIGAPLTVGGPGVLTNDGGGPLSVFSHTNPSHGTLTLNADGSFTYLPAAGFFGTDSFSYTASNATPSYDVQLFSTALPPLATFGGVNITAGGYGSAVALVPGSTNEVFGLTDRGPNVSGPHKTKVEPIPTFTPSIGKFLLTGDQAALEQIIPLQDPNGVPYSGRVNSQASTGETITDLNGNVLPTDPNGYDSEGLVAMPDGTFWVSDEYGPFITHFDATGKQNARLSPFDGSLPPELALRVPNKGMEGLTLTPDGTMLVGMMQSSLQQADLGGADPTVLTPLRIVTYRFADGALHEYLYLLDNPASTGTAVSEISAVTNTTFLVDERDGNFPPNAYKKLFLIDISGATDVGPNAAVPGAAYDGTNGGLRVGGQSIELLLSGQGTDASAMTLAAAGITPVTKSLALDINALVTSIDPQGRFFGHDKIEGVANLNGGATILVSNDSDFGIAGVTNDTPPFQLEEKITPAGVQDDGEYLLIDLVRSTATVNITVSDNVPPDTTLSSTPPVLTSESSASFGFSGTDVGTGVASFTCALDGASPSPCVSPVSESGLADGSHSFSVTAIDGAGNIDPTPASFMWTVDTTPPSFLVPSNLTIEATGPTGAVATFTVPATASDAIDGSDPVSCTGGTSGSIFALGTTTITCVSSDRAGNSAVHAFTVTVRDTTPPTIDAHADVTVTATSASGAIVAYTPPATHDAVDGTGVATCSPSSGSLFPIGQTLVICGATDAAHNIATPTTFAVIVIAPPAPISRFVAFSSDLTWLRAGATAQTGDVGANVRRLQGHDGDPAPDDGDSDDVTARIGIGASVAQPGSRVVGDTVLLLNNSSIYNVVDNFLLNRRGSTILGTKTSPMAVPFLTLPVFPGVAPGTQAVTVAKNKTVTLAPGSYGTVHVSNGATLVLTGGLYQMLSLDLDQSATVLFHAASEIRIKTELDSGSKSRLMLDPSVAGLDASKVVFYVAGQDSSCRHNDPDDDGDNAGPTSVHIGSQSLVQANIYALNGTVWLKSKTQATGAFIGVHVRIGINATLTLDSAFQ